jgi:hypothetical protein
MRKTDQSALALPLTTALPKTDDHGLMSEFAGMYQAGFEAGYKSGRESGYQQGLNDGSSTKREFSGQPATMNETPDGGAHEHVAVTPLPVEGQPATKNGPLDPDTRKARVPGPPRRMLLGMPCKHCRVYLMRDETHCPCCRQKVAQGFESFRVSRAAMSLATQPHTTP